LFELVLQRGLRTLKYVIKELAKFEIKNRRGTSGKTRSAFGRSEPAIAGILLGWKARWDEYEQIPRLLMTETDLEGNLMPHTRPW
jgi:hypothetical protein